MVSLELKGMSIGLVLCFIGLVVFIYGLNNMDWATAISNSFLAVVGMFLGIAGLIVFLVCAFSRGSAFN